MEFAIPSALIRLGPVADKLIARDNVEFAIRGSAASALIKRPLGLALIKRPLGRLWLKIAWPGR